MGGPKIYRCLWKIHERLNFEVKKLSNQIILVCVKGPWPWSYMSKRERISNPQTWGAACSFVNLVKTPKIGAKTWLSHCSPSFGLRAKVDVVWYTPGLGNLIFYQHLTDSPQNQHVFLLFLKIDKSKISKKSNENWSCYKLRTNSFSPRQPAGQIWWLSSQAGQNCSTFSFGPILLKIWI